jgi:hypothetical protein
MRTTILFALALALAPLGVLAQSDETLIERYTGLAGSPANAKALVSGLRDSTDIKLVYAGTPLTIDPPTGKMGNGNINIALALTEASLKDTAKPTAQQFQTALNGVLEQRASGRGWGEIANSLGFKLGEVVRSERAQPEARAARADSGRPDRADRAARAERPERPARPERPERAPGR